MTFFIELEQVILKFTYNHHRLRIVKAILRKKNKVGGITLPDFIQCYKATVIRTERCWHKSRQGSVGQTSEPGNKQHSHCQLPFNKGKKDAQWREDRVLGSGVEQAAQSHANH